MQLNRLIRHSRRVFPCVWLYLKRVKVAFLIQPRKFQLALPPLSSLHLFGEVYLSSLLPSGSNTQTRKDSLEEWRCDKRLRSENTLLKLQLPANLGHWHNGSLFCDRVGVTLAPACGWSGCRWSCRKRTIAINRDPTGFPTWCYIDRPSDPLHCYMASSTSVLPFFSSRTNSLDSSPFSFNFQLRFISLTLQTLFKRLW